MYSRELLKGILKPMILKLLSEHEKMHGYQMVKMIKEMSEDKILVKEGSLYPTLHALTKEGALTTESEMIGKRVRKYYRLSNHGKGVLESSTEEILDFSNMLSLMFTPKPSLT